MLIRKNFGSAKIVGLKKFWVKKNLGSKEILVFINFGFKKIPSPTKIGSEKILALFLRNRVKGGKEGVNSYALDKDYRSMCQIPDL